MPFFDPPPGCQILWLEHQACILCGGPATHVALALRLPKERIKQLKLDPSALSEVTISIGSKPYCTVCSPVISYEPDANGREPVPELDPVPPRKPGWFARKLGVRV